jgi:phosphatidylserine/phosphatidylglycerophosphate/cardiolipin synthase-like enzyme
MRARSTDQSGPRQAAVSWLEDKGHYDFLVQALTQARVSVWIGTANLKEVRMEAPIGSVARARKRFVSVADRFADLVGAGVELRVLHASEPSGPFRESLARRPALARAHEHLRRCPRVHLKLIVVDGTSLYLGSANFTGAGFGAKGEGRRNFELGITTTDHVMVDAAQRRFDRIWTGRECAGCKVRVHCPAPLDQL